MVLRVRVRVRALTFDGRPTLSVLLWFGCWFVKFFAGFFRLSWFYWFLGVFVVLRVRVRVRALLASYL